MQRRPEAKHCSSLCSQSEGDECCGGQARAENTTKSCPGALIMFATCSWPSLCEQSELQCWRRNRRLCGPAPLQGRVFKIQKNLCAFLSQIKSGEACAHDKRTKREKERPERAVSPDPSATPWVSAHKRLRPVRAKVLANGWLLLLPLQGVGNGDMVPRALTWALDLLGFQPAQGRRQGFFRTISTYLIFNFEHPTIKDLGKKWFGFSKMEILTPDELVERINRG